jgi:MFS family permease
VAGLIVATIGAPFALLLDAASFAVMAAICLGLQFRPAARQDVPAPAGRSRLGFGLLLRFPAVLVLTACGFGMLFLDGVATVLYPVYCRTFLDAGPAGYGALVAAAGAGALLGVVAGPALSGRLPPSLRIGVVIVAGAPLFGLLRFAPDLAVAAVLLGLATFAWGPYYVFARTLMQRLVPEDVRSRAAGARMTITSLGFPLGSAVGGAVIGGIGVPAVILAIACSYLALGLLPLLAPPLRATVEFTGATR